MVEELHAVYSDIKEDEACNTVVLYGASDKAFCAGGAAFSLQRLDATLLSPETPPVSCLSPSFFRARR
jgi:enoyl-CoA hydratase/carnithine racemase